MAVTWDLDIEDISFLCSLGRCSLDLVGSHRLQAQFARLEFNPAFHRVVFQVETVDDRRRFGGMDMYVYRLFESIKSSRLKEGFESRYVAIASLWAFCTGRVRVCSSKPQMAAGGSIPPERQTLGIIFSHVAVKVEGQRIGQVVIVQGNAVPADQVLHRLPHSSKAQSSSNPGASLPFPWETAAMAVVRRNVMEAAAAHHLIMHLDENIRIPGMDQTGQPVGGGDVLFTSRRKAVTMAGVPTFPVVICAVKHKERGAIARQNFEPRSSFFEVRL